MLKKKKKISLCDTTTVMVIMVVVTVTMMEIGYERSFWSQNKISGAIRKNPDLN
jgi:hypothetical protein